MSKQSLKVVCSGTGYFSQFHYDAWSRLSNVNIVGVCNRTKKAADEFAEKYAIPHSCDNLESLLMLTKPDLVDIITPPATHLTAVKIAARLGIDVICQKPFGETLEVAKQMVKIAEEAGIKLIVHENFRFMPWYRKIKQVLDSGSLGDVLNAEFRLRTGDGQGPEAYLSRQPYFQHMPKFLVHETAIHFIDTFRYLFGEPKSVYADLRRCNDNIQGEDAGIILFDFGNNMRAIFDGNRLLDHATTNPRRTMGEMKISGTKGELSLDGEARIWLRGFTEHKASELAYQWNDQNFGGDCVFNTIEHILQHYLTAQPIENTGKEYLANIRLEEAVYQSSFEARKIPLQSQTT
ncbi:Gfo/Idh/MocA family oxidoreductase [Paraglaciecola aquimarina]|uniref:Gfo/Idh/MocA family oxidoreductase n=1 Tax=Paraglaciecola aquimarina TaxID=1235557 RepID=A0ABU3SYB9_9ALTE|nr:Gfo/Idh/MocA family oxidoreductase [Paraglaciecola aquimarina]MDU0355009.1 Gfo/Idh/MocA family oxidoreductase [Paraglaciecola aquimarina]